MNSETTNVFPRNCVSLITKNLIYLENVSDGTIKVVEEINASPYEAEGITSWKIPFSDKLELAEKLKKLNSLGFVFAGGPAGWPPAEIFADLCEKKLLTGRFKEVRWRGPGDWFIIER